MRMMVFQFSDVKCIQRSINTSVNNKRVSKNPWRWRGRAGQGSITPYGRCKPACQRIVYHLTNLLYRCCYHWVLQHLMMKMAIWCDDDDDVMMMSVLLSSVCSTSRPGLASSHRTLELCRGCWGCAPPPSSSSPSGRAACHSPRGWQGRCPPPHPPWWTSFVWGVSLCCPCRWRLTSVLLTWSCGAPEVQTLSVLEYKGTPPGTVPPKLSWPIRTYILLLSVSAFWTDLTFNLSLLWVKLR